MCTDVEGKPHLVERSEYIGDEQWNVFQRKQALCRSKFTSCGEQCSDPTEFLSGERSPRPVHEAPRHLCSPPFKEQLSLGTVCLFPQIFNFPCFLFI